MFPESGIILECTPEHLKKLSDPRMQKSLAERYSGKVFWDVDEELKVWNNQPRNHRYEYFAAIEIYEQFGYWCLVEKYGGHGQRHASLQEDHA